MKFNSTSDSSKGSVYQKNEDHFLIKDDIGLHIVCDGSGEDGRGAIASQMTTEFIAQVMMANKKIFADYKIKPTDELRQNITELVEQAINKISLQILTTIANDKNRRQMGTTLSMVLVVGNGVFLAHIGNSRVYLERESTIHLLTDDHVLKNPTAELEKNGLSNNSISKKIGDSQQIKIDLLYFEVMHGDSIILMTDGAFQFVNDEKMSSIIKESKGFNLAKSLMNVVRQADSKENATVVTITFEDSAAKTDTISPQEKYSALLQIPLFSQLDYKEMAKVLTFMKARKYLKDDIIVKEGEAGEELFIILKGKADVVIQNKIIAELSGKDYFGELSLIDTEPRSATVKSQTNLEALVINRKNFTHLITHEPQISIKMLWRLTQTLSMRLRTTDKKFLDVDKTNSNINLNNIELKFE